MKARPADLDLAVAPDQPTKKTWAEANRVNLTTAFLDAERAKRPHRQKLIWDTVEPHLCVLVSRGPKHERRATLTFRVVYYLKTHPGKPHYKKLGRYPDGTFAHTNSAGKDITVCCDDLKAVRTAASEIYNLAKAGIDPKRPRVSGNFKDQVEDYIEQYVKKRNRTWEETQRIFDRYVLPEWQGKNVEDIEKSDVTALLNKIGEHRIKFDGRRSDNLKRPRLRWIGTTFVARATRAQLSAFFNWYIEHHSTDKFRSPIVPTKTWKAPSARKRVLGDDLTRDHDELRALWQAAGELGVYGAVIKTALLTAQRFHIVSTMRRAHLKERLRVSGENGQSGTWINHVWDATKEDDPENKQVSVVPLSTLARQIIHGVPITDTANPKDWVFTLNGREPIKGWSKLKDRLDANILRHLRQQAVERGDNPNEVQLKPWQHRDLRRTARTLMAQAGVSRDIAEHCLGHKIGGVEGVYDRHGYLPEKQEAFEKLAALVEKIVSPPPADNVIGIRSGGR